MGRVVSLPDGRRLELGYFMEWRPWLWAPAVADALAYVGDLRGKRVLEIGGRAGRMTALFAMLGARVTMIERCDLACAQAEVAKWEVADRVRLLRTTGGFEAVRGEEFDVIFTKSVLWSIEALGDFLDQISALLAAGGKVAFVENYRGGRLLQWFRRNVVHRGRLGYECRYRGIRPDQIPLFAERFAGLQVRRQWCLVYKILGESRRGGSQNAAPSDRSGSDRAPR